MSSPPPSADAYLAALRLLRDGNAPAQAFAAIADSLLDVVGAERVFVFRFRSSGGLRVVASRDIDREDVSEPLRRMSHHAVRRMESRGDVWAVEDARVDRRYRSEDVVAGAKPPRSILIFPLRARGELAGGVYLDHRFHTLEPSCAQRADVQAWVELCAVALSLADGALARRRLERLLSSPGRRPIDDAPPSVLPPSVPLPLSPSQTSPAEAEPVPTPVSFHGFLSANPDLLDTFDQLRQLSGSSLPILIHGETGTGKSLLARAIHDASSRSSGAFEMLSCGAVPETLIESELLGHARGAFTGADCARPGIFALADGGTLVLDEVADMSPQMQTKLLRVLEDGKLRSVGAKDLREVDVRVISTTSHDLERLVREGRFRQDLYFRLKSVVIEIPALRERREDIPGLAAHFLAANSAGTEPVELGADARQRLVDYPWPGNVRELQNEMRRLAALSRTRIAAADLSPALRAASARATLDGESARASLAESLDAAERAAVLGALRRSRGNKSRAATHLGITRKALYRRLLKYGLLRRAPRPEPAPTELPSQGGTP